MSATTLPILAALPFLLVAFAVFAMLPRTLNLLTMGEDVAAARGVEVTSAQRWAFLSASLATGAAVSLGGPIGFIGIIVPHLVRLMVGSDHRVVLPAAALFGAAFTGVVRPGGADDHVAAGIAGRHHHGPDRWTVLSLAAGETIMNTQRWHSTAVDVRFSAGFDTSRSRRGRSTRSNHRRIISLVPALTEMLFAIGAGPQVVAVSSYDEFPPQVKSLPRVGALLDPDTERILSLKPDLVVTYGSQVDLQTQLKRASIATFDYRHGGLDHIFTTIRELGQRTGPRRGGAERGRRHRIAHRRGQGPRRRQTAPAHAAGVQPRGSRASQHLRQRRPRLPARHAGRGGRTRMCSEMSAANRCRPPPRSSSRGRPR